MKRNYWLNALVLLALYGVGYWLATHLYQDDPSAMSWLDREAYNKKYIETIAKTPTTVSQPQVIQQLGGPDITEGTSIAATYYQLLYYRTHRTISDGITTKTECTALLFIDRQLVATGAAAEQRYYQVLHRK